jgi:predicted ATPase
VTTIPFLRSIRPVNLLSFGPSTQPIELRPLNILIGPNGGGKSNLFEVLGLLRSLTEKKPWSRVTETGGPLDWTWKKEGTAEKSSTEVLIEVAVEEPFLFGSSEETFVYQVCLKASSFASTFSIEREAVFPFPMPVEGLQSEAYLWRERESVAYPRTENADEDYRSKPPKVTRGASLLAEDGMGPLWELKNFFDRIKTYRDWTFGSGTKSRTLERVGLETSYLEEDSSNLAHVLNFILTHPDHRFGEKLRKALHDFSPDASDIETRFREGFVQLRIRESSGVSVPGSRLSDGTLRWLALLAILLNPEPAPVTCIEEPELGLHPDAIHTLADLLVDASTRTQLVVTTHSTALVDAFSDQPDAVCVCEKVDGATQIRRLDKEKLQVWLNDYSLGHLWASGEIGGNRW